MWQRGKKKHFLWQTNANLEYLSIPPPKCYMFYLNNIHLIMGVCPGCHSSGGWGGGMSYITHHYNVFRYIYFEFRGFYVWNFSWIFIQVSFVKRFCHIASHRMPNYYKDFAEFLHWLLLLFLIQLQRKRSIQNIYAYWNLINSWMFNQFARLIFFNDPF